MSKDIKQKKPLKGAILFELFQDAGALSSNPVRFYPLCCYCKLK